MHSAVPTCENCAEPIERYVSVFSERGIEEEMLACDCKAVRIRHAPRDARVGEDAVPDAWPSGTKGAKQ
jgi:hypothetical protein